ncbi:tRNA (adenosine(37)-N6)-threonylcarbamoyltransferase complex ATPase subunit type 1 TsaE [Aurantimonas sp. VKM B-3413]|uniref:tRNA (adenosine(37)-N6)-threonylcarbamoyltransferase complex ATPase subunit type 1 TsaE n=1 Tax=Aurantimonas sp. VKM B-3413 TaxID=2779401 RepID=UPI001E2A89A1|nr:tRNA (adenosine(37)-N6)-threonylcarbamoyltransferase complex ATPase subunit type 1 TsaE [Aurantimonas sp. VKM B-3413]MCB8840000.1 tRNA (adenosine(37)-N6)-threonylcarbamoyltransferase complex ATPase subunit type 1 TsaE [Aurantimonas sp. VKM B-3413]
MKAPETDSAAGGLGARTEGGETVHRIELADAAATCRLGSDLALLLRPGDLVALAGDLGAGKSTLARAAIRTIADDPDLEVPSPTYTLVQSYDTVPPVAHFDLYRIADPAELDELGLDEARRSGIVMVEWPERDGAILAEAAVVVELAMAPEGGRIATITARGAAAGRIARTLAIRAFLTEAGLGTAERHRFTGDASTRRYETLEDGGETVVLMDAPRQPDGPPIKDGLPYSRIAHLAEDVVPFVALAEALRSRGFAAPAIRRADLGGGLLLLDHLGSGSVLGADGRPIAERYEAAVLCLAELHRCEWPSELPVEGGIVHAVPPYDRRAMQAEVDLLIDWYLPFARKRQATPDERALYGEIWQALFDELEAAETSLTLRDFHSPNIIWRPEAEGTPRLGLIDFQDAMIGPAAYDVASLAQDARVDIPAELEAALVSAYIAARRSARPDFDAFGFERDYAIMAAQRASKILGIFVRLCERDDKPQYLRHIPRLKAYLRRTLDHPSLAALRSLYADWSVLDDPAAFPASGRQTT